MAINSEKLRSPRNIFISYILISSLMILLFRFIFPGAPVPLIILSAQWRFLRGLLEVFNLFPALALSALVIPFGLVNHEEQFSSFSQVLFKRLIGSVIIAISTALIYAIIFFFAFPMVKSSEENLRYKGDLYNLAREQATINSLSGNWQFKEGYFWKNCRIAFQKRAVAEPVGIFIQQINHWQIRLLTVQSHYRSYHTSRIVSIAEIFF